MPSEGAVTTVVGVIPIAETFGFSNDIRAASQGRAVWNTENLGFEMLPPQLFNDVVGRHFASAKVSSQSQTQNRTTQIEVQTWAESS